MRRIILFITLCCAFSTHSFTQSSFGFKTGYSINTTSATNLKLDNPSDIVFTKLEFIGQKNVISFGLSHRLLLGPCFFQQDVMFRKQTTLYQMLNFDDRLSSMSSYANEYTKIHLPISAGYIVHNIMIGAGPIFDYVQNTSSNETFDRLFRMEESPLNMGFQFLIGYQLGRHMQLEMKWEKSFTGVTDGYYYNDQKVNIRATPNLVSFNLGLYF